MEFPYIQNIDRDFKGQDLKVLAIASKGESAQRVREFFKEVKKTDGVDSTATVLLDSRGETARRYDTEGITPQVFFLDRQGKIVYQKFAYSEGNEEEFRQQAMQVTAPQPLPFSPPEEPEQKEQGIMVEATAVGKTLHDAVNVFECCILTLGAFTVILPAFLISGAIATFLSGGTIVRYFGLGTKKALSYGIASISGFFVSVCSCNVVPMFLSIYKRGAGIGPAFAFLYAAPAIHLVNMVFVFKVIGRDVGLARAVGVPIVSIITGLVMAWVFRKEDMERHTKMASLKYALEDESDPQRKIRIAGLFVMLFSILIVGATPLSYAYQFAIIGVLGAVAFLIAWRSFSKDELKSWMVESWKLGKMVVPIMLIAVIAIGYLTKVIPLVWIHEYFNDSTKFKDVFRSSLLASIFGAFMYFPILTEVAFAKGMLKEFHIGIGPAISLMLTGPGLSLPGMILIHKAVGFKKLVIYTVTVIAISTAIGTFFGSGMGQYLCACLMGERTPPPAF
ncbi:MAG: permease [Armatimonadetes bacterium]|nr:permease [Armatimonadota bacterium]